METIILKETKVCGNRVDFDYTYPEWWHTFMVDKTERIFYEYDFDLANIPISILNVPFVANMLVLAMFENATIEVDELDEDFYNSIPIILQGYKTLYSKYQDYKFECQIKVKNLVKNSANTQDKRIIAFTGGVDATSAVAAEMGVPIIIANIWGGDIKFEQEARHLKHKEYFKQFASQYNLEYSGIKSNCRFIYDDNLIPYKFITDWWCAIGHALVIACSLVPIAYNNNANTICLGSGHLEEDLNTLTIDSSNYGGIVNSIKFGAGSAKITDYEIKRRDKIKNIVKVLAPSKEKPIKILACWHHNTGKAYNCSVCDKCCRTILEITANKQDPNNFGFEVNEQTYYNIKAMFTSGAFVTELFFKESQSLFKQDKAFWKKYPCISWILTYKIGKKESKFCKAIKRPFVLIWRWSKVHIFKKRK